MGTRGWKSISWLALAGMGNVSAWPGPSSVLLPPNALHLESSTLKAPQRVPTIPPWLHVKMGNSGGMEKSLAIPPHLKKMLNLWRRPAVPPLRPGRAGHNQETRRFAATDVIKLLIYSSVLEKRRDHQVQSIHLLVGSVRHHGDRVHLQSRRCSQAT